MHFNTVNRCLTERIQTESQIRERHREQVLKELSSLTHWTNGQEVLTAQEFVDMFGANAMDAVCVGGWEGCKFEEN